MNTNQSVRDMLRDAVRRAALRLDGNGCDLRTTCEQLRQTATLALHQIEPEGESTMEMEFKPERIETMRERFPLALCRVFTTDEAHQAVMPSENVFDFTSGYRLIVTVATADGIEPWIIVNGSRLRRSIGGYYAHIDPLIVEDLFHRISGRIDPAEHRWSDSIGDVHLFFKIHPTAPDQTNHGAMLHGGMR